jgi:tRNA 2-thiouridine synthesizing protein D
VSSVALIVSTPPYSNLTVTALRFAQAVVDRGHSLTGIFFYQDGVLNANSLVHPPSDEMNLVKQWQTFSQSSATPLHLCISAAEKRGLSDGQGEHNLHNIADCFTVSGLGELVVLTSQADKTIQL